jgi:hypothetical protein
MEFEADYEEYGDEDGGEGTVASEFSKQSITTHHLLNLDRGILDDGEEDPDEDSDEDEIPQLQEQTDEDEATDDEDDIVGGEDDGVGGDNDDCSEEDETPFFAHVIRYTVDELLELGRLHVGYIERRLRRAKHTTKVARFKAHFGSIPKVICDIWEDLQTTEHAKAWVPPSKRSIKHYLAVDGATPSEALSDRI